MAAVLKTVDRKVRGFESLPLRQARAGVGRILRDGLAVTPLAQGASMDSDPPDELGVLTDEVATLLFRLDAGSLTTSFVTARITQAIAEWALSRGWWVGTEARVDVRGSHAGASRPGYIDVVIRRAGLARDVAIEIDSADKPWSVAKLRHAAAAGMHAIWIRWGDDEWAGIYDGIHVIQLRIARLAGRRPGHQGQLALWPDRTSHDSRYARPVSRSIGQRTTQ